MTWSKTFQFSYHFLGKINLFQFSIFSKFQNLDIQGKKPKMLVKVLLKARNTLFSAKIRKFSFSQPSQGVRNYESENSQTVSKMLFVEIQGVMSFKFLIFLVKFQELIPFYDLE